MPSGVVTVKQAGRRRVKISATLDPELVDALDAYVTQHPEADRSGVLDEALTLWLAAQQDRAMAEQFAGDGAPEDERQVWRSMQRQAVQRWSRRDG